MEEEIGLKKDVKPYLIFICDECEQYMYVKPSQKKKKCLRCGKKYNVPKLHIVDEVKGMSAAVERVKELQKTLSDRPKFNSEGEFSVPSHKSPKIFIEEISSEIHPREQDSSERQFKDLLQEISKHHRSFPKYMAELLAEEYRLEKNELELYLREYIKKGFLRPMRNNYFSFA
ncbi:MAG: DUF1922 domain-containing protein [Candidatus Lokiarchaeota archaeon]|nr:DUF1922 domain-containing protein [Candidatus Lokiarchaeota archaeon]